MAHVQENVSVVDILRDLLLPQGFGFRPTDDEIITHYLKPKVEGQQVNNLIQDIEDAYAHDPEFLSTVHKTMTTGTSPKWYFYTKRNQNYTGRSLYERVTPSGYWKPTSSPRISIEEHNVTIGFKKKFVFYLGRRPRDQETEWTMLKFSLPENEYENASQLKDVVVLYRDAKGSTVSTDVETSAPPEIASNVPEQTDRLKQAELVMDCNTSCLLEDAEIITMKGAAPASLKRNPEHQSVHKGSEDATHFGSSEKRQRILPTDNDDSSEAPNLLEDENAQTNSTSS